MANEKTEIVLVLKDDFTAKLKASGGVAEEYFKKLQEGGKVAANVNKLFLNFAESVNRTTARVREGTIALKAYNAEMAILGRQGAGNINRINRPPPAPRPVGPTAEERALKAQLDRLRRLRAEIAQFNREYNTSGTRNYGVANEEALGRGRAALLQDASREDLLRVQQETRLRQRRRVAEQVIRETARLNAQIDAATAYTGGSAGGGLGAQYGGRVARGELQIAQVERAARQLAKGVDENLVRAQLNAAAAVNKLNNSLREQQAELKRNELNAKRYAEKISGLEAYQQLLPRFEAELKNKTVTPAFIKTQAKEVGRGSATLDQATHYIKMAAATRQATTGVNTFTDAKKRSTIAERTNVQELKNLERGYSKFHNILGSTGELIKRVGIGFLAWRAYREVERTLESSLHFLSELEQRRLGVAETLGITVKLFDQFGRAVPLSDQMAVAFNKAQLAIQQMSQDSLRLGLPLGELTEAFAVTAGAAAEARIELGDSVEIIDSLVVLARRVGVPFNVLARDVRDIFTGLNVQRTILGNLLGLSQSMVREWVKQGTLAAHLKDQLSLVTETAKENLTTFEGLTLAIRNSINLLISAAGQRGFETLKLTLADIFQQLETARADPKFLEKLSETLNNLAEALRGIIKLMSAVVSHPLLATSAVIGFQAGRGIAAAATYRSTEQVTEAIARRVSTGTGAVGALQRAGYPGIASSAASAGVILGNSIKATLAAGVLGGIFGLAAYVFIDTLVPPLNRAFRRASEVLFGDIDERLPSVFEFGGDEVANKIHDVFSEPNTYSELRKALTIKLETPEEVQKKLTEKIFAEAEKFDPFNRTGFLEGALLRQAVNPDKAIVDYQTENRLLGITDPASRNALIEEIQARTAIGLLKELRNLYDSPIAAGSAEFNQELARRLETVRDRAILDTINRNAAKGADPNAPSFTTFGALPNIPLVTDIKKSLEQSGVTSGGAIKIDPGFYKAIQEQALKIEKFPEVANSLREDFQQAAYALARSGLFQVQTRVGGAEEAREKVLRLYESSKQREAGVESQNIIKRIQQGDLELDPTVENRFIELRKQEIRAEYEKIKPELDEAQILILKQFAGSEERKKIQAAVAEERRAIINEFFNRLELSETESKSLLREARTKRDQDRFGRTLSSQEAADVLNLRQLQGEVGIRGARRQGELADLAGDLSPTGRARRAALLEEDFNDRRRLALAEANSAQQQLSIVYAEQANLQQKITNNQINQEDARLRTLELEQKISDLKAKEVEASAQLVRLSREQRNETVGQTREELKKALDNARQIYALAQANRQVREQKDLRSLAGINSINEARSALAIFEGRGDKEVEAAAIQQKFQGEAEARATSLSYLDQETRDALRQRQELEVALKSGILTKEDQFNISSEIAGINDRLVDAETRRVELLREGTLAMLQQQLAMAELARQTDDLGNIVQNELLRAFDSGDFSKGLLALPKNVLRQSFRTAFEGIIQDKLSFDTQLKKNFLKDIPGFAKKGGEGVEKELGGSLEGVTEIAKKGYGFISGLFGDSSGPALTRIEGGGLSNGDSLTLGNYAELGGKISGGGTTTLNGGTAAAGKGGSGAAGAAGLVAAVVLAFINGLEGAKAVTKDIQRNKLRNPTFAEAAEGFHSANLGGAGKTFAKIDQFALDYIAFSGNKSTALLTGFASGGLSLIAGALVKGIYKSLLKSETAIHAAGLGGLLRDAVGLRSNAPDRRGIYLSYEGQPGVPTPYRTSTTARLGRSYLEQTDEVAAITRLAPTLLFREAAGRERIPRELVAAILGSAQGTGLAAEDAVEYAKRIITRTVKPEDIEAKTFEILEDIQKGRLTQGEGLSQLAQFYSLMNELPDVIDKTTFGLVALAKDGTYSIEQLKRAGEDLKRNLEQGVGGFVTESLTGDNIYNAGAKIGESLYSGLVERFQERFLETGTFGEILTKASTSFTAAAEAFSRGDVAGGQALLTRGRKEAAQLQQDLYRGLAPVIPVLRSVGYSLGALGGGGFIGQTLSFDTPDLTRVPGPRGMPVASRTHGGEVIQSGQSYDRNGDILEDIRDLQARALAKNQPIVVQFIVDGKVMQEMRPDSNSVKVPKPMLGVNVNG